MDATEQTEQKGGVPSLSKGITRRQFIQRFAGLAWVAASVALVGELGGILLGFFIPQVKKGVFGGKITAGKVDDFPPGSMTYVSSGRFFIARLDSGFLALYRVCTHLGCVVAWDETEGQFHCPCHAAIFDARGEVLDGPAPRPMDFFPLEIVDGEIVVDTGQATKRTEFDTSQVTSA